MSPIEKEKEEGTPPGRTQTQTQTHQKTNVSQETDKIRKHERELENVKSY